MGSEMCIRDSFNSVCALAHRTHDNRPARTPVRWREGKCSFVYWTRVRFHPCRRRALWWLLRVAHEDLAHGAAGTIMSTQQASAGIEKSASTRVLTFPPLPQENNILAHKATQWIEAAETELMEKGMLGVARGGLPRQAMAIIDTPVVADRGELSRRELQQMLQIEAENRRNAVRREELWLSAWTSLLTALGAERHGRSGPPHACYISSSPD